MTPRDQSGSKSSSEEGIEDLRIEHKASAQSAPGLAASTVFFVLSCFRDRLFFEHHGFTTTAPTARREQAEQ